MVEMNFCCEAMKLAGINCEYKNDSLIEINNISIHIIGSLAQFGTYKFRFSDVYDFLCALDQSGLLFLSINDKHKIKDCYNRLISLATSKAKVTKI